MVFLFFGFVWSWFVLFVSDCDFLEHICLIRVLWSRECCDFERFVRFG